MTNRRSRKKTTPAVGKGGAGIGRDVSGSTIITGDGNTIQPSSPLGPVASPTAAMAPLHQLRPPVGDFVGREREIETLIDALRHGSRAGISGINGMGGIGKTELALLVAERLSNDYPDAQLLINLQGTDPNPRPPEQVMEICIRAFLGPEARLPEDLDQLSQLYRNQLNGKRVLLLLDNVADSAQVSSLLPPAGCALLVTSRRTIVLPGMMRFTLNPLTDYEARDLLLAIAPNAQSAAENICALCGNLPLAIRAAGSLLAITLDLDPVDYATLLNDERNRLERIGAEGVDIGVAASLNLSYARLTPEAASVFRVLSVFPSTFAAAAAEVVCSDEGHIQLSDLVRRSLVLYDSDTKRYRVHDLARLFANEKLSAEERDVGLKRHATHYKGILAAAGNLYLQGGEALVAGLALFDLEWGNIQVGHAWIAAQGNDADEDLARLSLAYPGACAEILDLRQHSREQIRWLEIALAAARQLIDRAGEARVLGNLGIAYKNLGETEQAIQFYKELLIIVRELGDRGSEGAALANLGNAHYRLSEFESAIAFNEQSLTIARELGDRRNEGAVLGNLGIAYTKLGRIELAIQFYEQQLTIVRDVGDRRGEGRALGNLGAVYAGMGKTELAIQFYEQRLVIAGELGDRRGEGVVRWNMCQALDLLGQRTQAIQHAQQSLKILEEIEDPRATMVRTQLAVWSEETTSK